jgi:agmatinase
MTKQPDAPVRGPVDATAVPRYGGPSTFARLPRLDEVEHADVAVVGVPFDSGVSYRPGARFGPGHIRASSKLLRTYNPVQDVEPFPTSTPGTPTSAPRSPMGPRSGARARRA